MHPLKKMHNLLTSIAFSAFCRGEKSLGEKCKNVTFTDVAVRNFKGLSVLGQNNGFLQSMKLKN
jgi:hypothetical protein